MHRDLIQDLLFCKNKNKYKDLRVSNRLLLIILLSVADEFGVSNKFGSTEIRKLTGMKPDALKTQIDKLKKQGFINSHVKGGSCKYLFGVTVASYFINLDHNDFLLFRSKTAKFICSIAEGRPSSNEKSNTMDLVELRKIIEHLTAWYGQKMKSNCISPTRKERWEQLKYGESSILPIDNYEEFQYVACFFMNGWSASHTNILQNKLNELASFFLSNYFDNLSGEETLIEEELITEELIENIKPSLFPVGLLKTVEGGEIYEKIISSKQQVNQLTKYILRIAIFFAKKIHQVLSLNRDIQFNKLRLCVRPNFYQKEIYFVIDSNLKADKELYVFYEMGDRSYVRNEEMPPEYHMWGLLCNSNRKETDWGKVVEARKGNDDV